MTARIAKSNSICKGIFPLFKRPGIAAGEPTRWLTLQLKNDMKAEHYVKVKTFGPLHKQASGVMTLAIEKSCPYLKYLKFCEVAYEAKARLGFRTGSGFLDSSVNGVKPCNHVTKELLEDCLQSFVGSFVQKNISSVTEKGYSPPFSEFMDKEILGLLSSRTLDFHSNLSEVYRTIECVGVKLIDYNLPDITFQVEGRGILYMPELLRDVAEKLDTYGTFISLVKLREGPFTIDDCVDQLDFDLEYLKPHLEHFTPIFLSHIMPHRDKLSLPEPRRVS